MAAFDLAASAHALVDVPVVGTRHLGPVMFAAVMKHLNA